ncbi:hypothetical protein KW800_02130 [Candidatus Parcubacteria bacterium]|nr:hypothetical protein [Candidatus Parcubacteria bacterium]
MTSAVRTVETLAVRHHLHELFGKFDDLAVNHLFQIARNGGLHGKSHRANVIARLIEGETGRDFSELSEDEARAVANDFRERKKLKILPQGGLDPIERYFADVEPSETAATSPRLELLAEFCDEWSEQQGTMGI